MTVPAVPAEGDEVRPVSTERVRPDSRIAELERRLDSLGRTYNEQAAKLRRAQEWGQQQESRAIKAERVARHAALAVSPPAPDTDNEERRAAEYVIAYEVVLPGTDPLAVLIRRRDGHPILALSAGTTLDSIVSAAAPAPLAETREAAAREEHEGHLLKVWCVDCERTVPPLAAALSAPPAPTEGETH